LFRLVVEAKSEEIEQHKAKSSFLELTAQFWKSGGKNLPGPKFQKKFETKDEAERIS